MSRHRIAFACAVVALIVFGSHLAQAEQILHSFSGGAGDGAAPQESLIPDASRHVLEDAIGHDRSGAWRIAMGKWRVETPASLRFCL